MRRSARKHCGKRQEQAVDGVHVRVFIGQALLYRAIDLLHDTVLEWRQWRVDRVERQAARPNVRFREVAVDVEPSGAGSNRRRDAPRAALEEGRPRKVVVVGFDNDVRASGDGDEVSDVLARVAAHRARRGKAQTEVTSS